MNFENIYTEIIHTLYYLFFQNNIVNACCLAFISVLADCCQLKLKNRCIGVCYLILTFILHEISFALYFMTIIDSLGVYPHYIVIRIVIAFTVIASLMNTFNHVMLIYHTLCKVSETLFLFKSIESITFVCLCSVL